LSVKVAILGTGNIGTDLLKKIIARSERMDVAMFAGIDPESEGLARARSMGIPSSSEGIRAILDVPGIQIVFDATSAKAHLKHAPQLEAAGIVAIDLTPAAVGPYFVPAVDMELKQVASSNVNMVTCGGQGTIPMVYAVSRVHKVRYAETISTISSVSAGPGTRANIDEFTVTTARAVSQIGGADRAKAIIVLNPAQPPILCQNTIYAELEEAPDQEAVTKSVHDMVENVRRYVPGYRLKYDPIFDDNRITLIVEVEGAGDYLPKYAGNLDIMTSAAMAAGDAIALRLERQVKGETT
jgi:acetaldehyde dehydrogenase